MANQETKKAPRPMLIFAGAAAVVLALAVPLLLFFRGSGQEVVATTTTLAPVTSTVPPPQSTTTTPEPTSSTVPVAAVWSRPVFLIQTPENSFAGNPALIPVWMEVTDPAGQLSPDAQFTDVLAQLGGQLPTGLSNAIPGDVRIVSLTTGQGPDGSDVWVADMNDAFLDGAGGLLADTTMLNQLVYTITYQTVMDHVLFTVGGQPIDAYGTEGIVLTDPVGRDDYLDDMASIFLTEPILEFENVYAVTGRANTFEASVSVKVIDSNGETVHEEHTTATCGSGCWGEFGVGVAADLVVPGQTAIQVLDYSAKDGSPVDVITVPIYENGVWAAELSG